MLALLLCACLGWSVPARAAEKEIVASVFPVWLLLRQVAQDVPGVETGLLLPAGTGCPHDYSMTPQDRRRLARADMLVVNGLGLESFLGEGDRVRQLMKPGAAVLDISRNVEGILHEEADTGHEGHARANPHIFAAPSMMARMAVSLARQLAAADPEHAEQYETNGRRAEEAFSALARECSEHGARLAGRSIVTQHNVFDYLARDLGLSVDADIQRHEGQEPSAREMLDLVRLIRGRHTAAVVTEPQYPARTGRTLASEAGVPCLSLDPAASGPADAPLDYYELVMRGNLRLLEQTLGTR